MTARPLPAAGAALLAACLVGRPAACAGLLEIRDTGAAGCVLLDFDSVVASGHNGVYEGAGMNPGGPAGGVCSNTWAVRGFGDGVPMTRDQAGQNRGDAEFTRTYITRRGPGPDGQPTDLPSDFARGTSLGVSTEAAGMYGYDVGADPTSADRAFGFRTGGGEFGDVAGGGSAGEIFFRMENNTGETVRGWELSYDVLTLNDTDRDGELTLGYALPGTEGQVDPTLVSPRDGAGPLTYETLAAGAVTLAGAADAAGWARTGRTLRIAAEVAQSEIFQLRWRLDGLTGTAGAAGDAFALDNIKVTAFASAPAAVPEPGSLALLSLAGLGFAARRRRK